MPDFTVADMVKLVNMAAATIVYDHIWWWRKWLPERKGQRCRVLIRSRRKIRNILVEFEDGVMVVTTRWAVRRSKA